MTLRATALKLFAKVYGLKIASTYLVKKKFPKFRASIKDHWEFLIIKLLHIYREQQRKLTLESSKDLTKLTDKQLRELAVSRGINPLQTRFKLLAALGVVSEKPTLSDRNTLTSRRRGIRQWDGKGLAV